MASSTFKIHVPDDKLQRLKQKLALADFPDDASPESSKPWSRGVPISEIKRLAEIWRTSYDWRKAETHLDSFSQSLTTVEVDGFGAYEIHHIHERSARDGAIPLLFLHGWPGSFIEATKILPDLVKGSSDGPAFHVVAPSLIDFGFSAASGKGGFLIEHHAEAYDKLMQALGYNNYVIQAGDLGFVISRFISKKYGPSRCKALHTNTALPAQPDPKTHPNLHAKFVSTPLTEAEQDGLQRAASFMKEGDGYYKQQSTKPLTIGYSLKDSPVGLLAWLYEKMHDWTDNYQWSDEEILTWVSIHYFSTAGPDASSNVYYAMEHNEPTAFVAAQAYIDVPLGITRFSNDLVLLPKLWNESLGPIVFENEHQSGGHFAAWERPDIIVADVRNMFKNYHGGFKMPEADWGN